MASKKKRASKRSKAAKKKVGKRVATRGAASPELLQLRERLAATKKDPSYAFTSYLESGSDRLTLIPDRLLLKLRRALAKRALDALLESLDLRLDDGGASHLRINNTRVFYWVRSGKPISKRRLAKIEALGGKSLSQIIPVYQLGGTPGPYGVVAVMPDRLLLEDRPIGKATRASVVQKLNDAGFSLHAETSGLLPRHTVFTAGKKSEVAAHELSPTLHSPKPTDPRQATSPIVHELAKLVSRQAAPHYPPAGTRFGEPNDVEDAGKQWNMKRVGASYAWGTSGAPNLGSANTNVFIVDAGVEMNHPDLPQTASAYAAGEITQVNAETGNPDAAGTPPGTDHGTQMAGILASPQPTAASQMAGFAPGARTISLRATNMLLTNVEVAAMLGFVKSLYDSGAFTTERGVVLLGAEVDELATDPALTAYKDLAVHDIVVVAPAGNASAPTAVAFPVADIQDHLIIVGGSEIGTNGDDAWNAPAGPADQGSKRGPQISVVAPAKGLITTTTGGAHLTDARGTSLAAAHVAGLIALLLEQEPALTPALVRARLEQCAARGTTMEFVTATSGGLGTSNGPRNDEMGHGRVDGGSLISLVQRADVYIKDDPTDDGTEPSTSSKFWRDSDIIAIPESSLASVTEPSAGVFATGSAEDVAFTNAQLAIPRQVKAGERNRFYIRVYNKGPGTARGVSVSLCVAACSTGFQYPEDWESATDATHTRIVPDPAVAADMALHLPYATTLETGQVFIARLILSASGAAFAWGTHACSLARVQACNDLDFVDAVINGSAVGPGKVRAVNNLAQRNLHVV